MRRLVIIGTALAVLVGATAAYAAFSNSYGGTKVFWSPKKAGSPAKPVPVGETEVLKASSSTIGNRAAPLTDIKTSFYGWATWSRVTRRTSTWRRGPSWCTTAPEPE